MHSFLIRFTTYIDVKGALYCTKVQRCAMERQPEPHLTLLHGTLYLNCSWTHYLVNKFKYSKNITKYRNNNLVMSTLLNQIDSERIQCPV